MISVQQTTPLIKLYRQLWREFDYGLITKEEFNEKLRELTKK